MKKTDHKQDVFTYLEERFLLERDLFQNFTLYLASKGRIYLGPKNLVQHPRIATVGLLIARISGTIKPTTNLLQLFGRSVKKNFIYLTKDNAKKYARGDDLFISPEEMGDATAGYVLLRYLDFSLGCGLLKDNKIKNMLPKAKRLELQHL